MIVTTVLRDCVYLNWAIPLARLPPAPHPLRYEVHTDGKLSFVFASALLFHHDRLRMARAPTFRFSYPQCNLRLYVTDGDGVPAVYFAALLVPRWVVPGARCLSKQPVQGASFDFAQPSRSIDAKTWKWSVRKGASLTLEASIGSQGLFDASTTAERAPSVVNAGGNSIAPSLGSLKSRVRFFSQRARGYSMTKVGLQLIEARHRISAVWPLQVEIRSSELLEKYLHLTGEELLPALHSAWLCPEIPFSFELKPEFGSKVRSPRGPSVAADPAMYR